MDKLQTTEAIRKLLELNKPVVDKVAKEHPQFDEAVKSLLLLLDKKYGEGNFTIPVPQVSTPDLPSWQLVVDMEWLANDAMQSDNRKRLLYKDLPEKLQTIALIEQKFAGNEVNNQIKLVANKADGGFGFNYSAFGDSFWQKVNAINFKQYYFEPTFYDDYLDWKGNKRERNNGELDFDKFVNMLIERGVEKIGDLYPRFRLNIEPFVQKYGLTYNTLLNDFEDKVMKEWGGKFSSWQTFMYNFYTQAYEDSTKWLTDPSAIKPTVGTPTVATGSYLTFDEAVNASADLEKTRNTNTLGTLTIGDLPVELQQLAYAERQKQRKMYAIDFSDFTKTTIDASLIYGDTAQGTTFWKEIEKGKLFRYYYEPQVWENPTLLDIKPKTVEELPPRLKALYLDELRIYAKGNYLGYEDYIKDDFELDLLPQAIVEFSYSLANILDNNYANIVENLFTMQTSWAMPNGATAKPQTSSLLVTYQEATNLEDLVSGNEPTPKELPELLRVIVDQEISLQGNVMDENNRIGIGKSNGGFDWDESMLGYDFYQQISGGFFRQFLFEPMFWSNLFLFIKNKDRDKMLSDAEAINLMLKSGFMPINEWADLPPRFKLIMSFKTNKSLIEKWIADSDFDKFTQEFYDLYFDSSLYDDQTLWFVEEGTTKRTATTPPVSQTVSKTSTSNKSRVKGTTTKAKATTKATATTKKSSSKSAKVTIPDIPDYKKTTMADYDTLMASLNSNFNESLIGSKRAQPTTVKGQTIPKYAVGFDGNIYRSETTGSTLKWILEDDYDNIGRIKNKDEMLILIARSLYDMQDARGSNDKGLWEIYRDDYEMRKDDYEKM